MPSLATAISSPGTTITTTTETLCANVPATPLALPGGAPAVIVIDTTVWITTGTGVTALQVKIRAGQNNTTTNQIGQTAQIPVIASALQAYNIAFFDNVPANLPAGGYSITVTQVGATGNGTVTAAGYQVSSTP